MWELSKDVKGVEDKAVKMASEAVDIRLERATETIEKESVKVLTSSNHVWKKNSDRGGKKRRRQKKR